jgi:phage gp16-like protein
MTPVRRTPPKNTTQIDTVRNGLIAKIHVAKKQLVIDEEAYRALLQSEVKKDSLKAMSVWELEKIVERMTKLGFRVQKSSDNRTHDRQSKKIRALWLDLAKSGLVKDPNESALCAFVKRRTGVDALQWLSTEQAAKVIEVLKKWSGRAGSK